MFPGKFMNFSNLRVHRQTAVITLLPRAAAIIAKPVELRSRYIDSVILPAMKIFIVFVRSELDQ